MYAIQAVHLFTEINYLQNLSDIISVRNLSDIIIYKLSDIDVYIT